MHIWSQWVRAAGRIAVIVAIGLAPLPVTASHGPDEHWSDWEGLGGILSSEPSAASWHLLSPPQLHVFARGADNALWHIWYSRSRGWSAWQSLGGALTSAPSVAARGSGHLDVFARGLDNALWHKWYAVGGNWSNWESLGGVLTSAPSAVWGRVSTPQGYTSRLNVFARGADNALWRRSYDDRIGWTAWESLGGFLTSAPGAAAGGTSMMGRLDVLARGGDNALWHRQFTPESGWMDWVSRGGILTSAPAASIWSPFRNRYQLHVFVRGADNGLWHRWGDFEQRRWSNWEDRGGVLTSGPATVSFYIGRLDVFVRGADNALWHRWLTSP
jgi:hypothetical protein